MVMYALNINIGVEMNSAQPI